MNESLWIMKSQAIAGIFFPNSTVAFQVLINFRGCATPGRAKKKILNFESDISNMACSRRHLPVILFTRHFLGMTTLCFQDCCGEKSSLSFSYFLILFSLP